jgi:hypothetical protein
MDIPYKFQYIYEVKTKSITDICNLLIYYELKFVYDDDSFDILPQNYNNLHILENMIKKTKTIYVIENWINFIKKPIELFNNIINVHENNKNYWVINWEKIIAELNEKKFIITAPKKLNMSEYDVNNICIPFIQGMGMIYVKHYEIISMFNLMFPDINNDKIIKARDQILELYKNKNKLFPHGDKYIIRRTTYKQCPYDKIYYEEIHLEQKLVFMMSPAIGYFD